METHANQEFKKFVNAVSDAKKTTTIPPYLVALLFAIEFNILWLIITFSILLCRKLFSKMGKN